MNGSQKDKTIIYPAPYSKLLSISHPTHGEYHFILDTYSGHSLLIADSAYKALNSSKTGDEETRFELQRLLLKKGLYTVSPAQPDALLAEIREKIDLQKDSFLQFGVNLDEYNSQSDGEHHLDSIFSTINTIAINSKPAKTIFHLWLFGKANIETQRSLFLHIENYVTAQSNLTPDTEGIEIVINTNGLSPINSKVLPASLKAKTTVKLFVDTYFDVNGNGRAYFSDIVKSIINLGESRIKTGLIFNFRRSNMETLLKEYLRYFMESGLYLNLINCIYYLPRNETITEGYYLCEYDNTDWEFLLDLQAELLSNEQYEVFKLFGAGVLSKLENLAYYKKPISPDVYFCPVSRNAFILHGNGSIYACPKGYLLNNGLGTIGSYDPTFNLYPGKIEKWHNRSVDRIESCSNCTDVFLCSGGCPFEAVVKNADTYCSSCQDIDSLLGNEVYYNLDKLFAREDRLAFLRSQKDS